MVVHNNKAHLVQERRILDLRKRVLGQVDKALNFKVDVLIYWQEVNPLQHFEQITPLQIDR